MSRFWAGFAVASIAWGAAAAYLVYVEGFGPPVEEVPEPVAEASVVEEAEPEPEPDSRRRRRRRRRARRRGGVRSETPTGTATVGDDLREGEARTLDMEGTGGEQQLTASQIEAGFDGAMGGIRRCLILMPGDAPVTGRLVFALRVGPSGGVQGVQLSGPRAATTGEAGGCLQRAARAIEFDSFDGPPMVVRYPITLE